MVGSMVRCMVRSVMEGGRAGRSIAWPRLRVDGGALVLHVSNEAALVVCSVGDNLDTTVREGNTVLSCHHSVLVLDFFLCKVCARVSVLRGG